jgi:hypothetical protein
VALSTELWCGEAERHLAAHPGADLYLVGLDEHRERIFAEFGIDTRRASALVLVGYPQGDSGVAEEDVNEALRIHNSHLNRVEVRTYKELIDSAERALAVGDAG